MVKSFILSFLLLTFALQLSAVDNLMVSGGFLGKDHNQGVIIVFYPESGKSHTIKLPTTDIVPLLSTTACFDEKNSKKILYLGSDSFSLVTLNADKEPTIRNVTHASSNTSQKIKAILKCLFGICYQFTDLLPFGYSESQIPSRLITTAALIEKENTFSILIGDRDGFITEYDSSGTQIRVLPAQQNGDVSSLMMYRDEQNNVFLISAAMSGNILVIDFSSGEVIQQYQAPQNTTSLVVYKNGNELYLIAGMNGYTMPNNPMGGIIAWNMNTKEKLYETSYDSAGSKGQENNQWGFVNGLVLVGDKLFTIANDTSVKLWNPIEGSFIGELNNGLQPCEAWVTSVVPYTVGDKNYLVVGNTKGRVDFWNLENITIEYPMQMPTQGPRGASVFCRDISLMKGKNGNIVCVITGDSGVIVSVSVDTYETISEIQPTDNTLLLRSVAASAEQNTQTGIICNSDGDASGYNVQCLLKDKNLSL